MLCGYNRMCLITSLYGIYIIYTVFDNFWCTYGNVHEDREGLLALMEEKVRGRVMQNIKQAGRQVLHTYIIPIYLDWYIVD